MKHRDWTDWTSIGFEVAKPSGSLEPCNGTSNSSFVWNCKEKSEICETAMSVSTPWKLVFNNKNRDVTKQGGCDGMIVEINWGTVSFLEYTGEDSWKLNPLPKGCRIMSDVVWYWIITKKTVHLEKCSKPKTIQNHPQPFSKTSRTLKKKGETHHWSKNVQVSEVAKKHNASPQGGYHGLSRPPRPGASSTAAAASAGSARPKRLEVLIDTEKMASLAGWGPQSIAFSWDMAVAEFYGLW